MASKTVEGIEWDSSEGQMLYREVYSDGTRSGQISVPDMPVNLPPKKFRRMKEQIERTKIGRVVQIVAPLRQRRW